MSASGIPTQAVSLCGGLGERLLPLTADCPKALVPVGGRPFIEYQIEQAQAQGVREFLILAGRMPERFLAHFAGRPGVKVVPQPGPWQTGRRLREALPHLAERFVVLYNDNFAPVSFAGLAALHGAKGRPLTLTACAREGGNVSLLGDYVRSYGKDPACGHVEIGYLVAERDRLAPHLTGGNLNETLAALASRGELAAFAPRGLFYHSIGDVPRLRKTEAHLAPKKVLLIDRDGVLNRKAPRAEYVSRPVEWVWLEDNVRGLEELAAKGFTFIVLTNQAGVGRGVVRPEDVEALHSWMAGELQRRGVFLRDILVCPHAWDAGCACRKPLPGMFFEAARRHDFRLDHALYVGDDLRDIQAAEAAGTRCLTVDDDFTLADGVPHVLATYNSWGCDL